MPGRWNLSAPATRAGHGFPLLPLLSGTTRGRDPGSESCPNLWDERVVFHELLQTGHRFSFIKYLNHYRVERSQALLANTDESMASISQEMGFCDQSYFGAVFHRLVGMTPAAYRRRFRNKSASEGRQMDHTPPITASGISLTGTSHRSTADINRQLASSESKSYKDQFRNLIAQSTKLTQ